MRKGKKQKREKSSIFNKHLPVAICTSTLIVVLLWREVVLPRVYLWFEQNFLIITVHQGSLVSYNMSSQHMGGRAERGRILFPNSIWRSLEILFLQSRSTLPLRRQCLTHCFISMEVHFTRKLKKKEKKKKQLNSESCGAAVKLRKSFSHSSFNVLSN